MIGQYVTVAGDVISHVNISRVAVEDGGVYECAAENRVGRTTHSAPLRVYGNVTHTVMVVVAPTVDIYINTFTAIVDLSRSNFSIARTPLFQLKSAM